jgi:MFS family permease
MDTDTPSRPTRLSSNRPFGWLVASYGVRYLAVSTFFVVLMAQAAYRFQAGSSQLALLFASYSLAFIAATALFGMVTDVWSPKAVLLVVQVVGIVAVVPALVGGSMGWLYLSSVLLGISAAGIMPARGSLIALLVEERDLVRANAALNTVAMLGGIVGPAVAGLLIRAVGVDVVYWAMAGCFALAGLLLIPVPDLRSSERAHSALIGDLVVGFRATWREPELRTLLGLTCVAWFFFTVWSTLEALFVKDVLHRGADAVTFLWAANGLGSFLGALALTRSRRASGREALLMGISLLIGGAGFLAFAGTSSVTVAVAGTAAMGVSVAWFLSLSQALIQRVARENERGRVTGVQSMVQEGTGLLCSLSLAAMSGLVTVRPFLLGAAALVTASGIAGLRAARRTVGHAPGRRATRPHPSNP